MVTTAISGDVTLWSVIGKYFSDMLDKIVNVALHKLKLFHEMREAKAKRMTAEIDQEIAEAKRESETLCENVLCVQASFLLTLFKTNEE